MPHRPSFPSGISQYLAHAVHFTLPCGSFLNNSASFPKNWLFNCNNTLFMHFNIIKWLCSLKEIPRVEDSDKSAGNVNSQSSDFLLLLSYAKPPFNYQMFCGIVTRNYTKGSHTHKTIPRLEITLRLLKKPLVICLIPLFSRNHCRVGITRNANLFGANSP